MPDSALAPSRYGAPKLWVLAFTALACETSTPTADRVDVPALSLPSPSSFPSFGPSAHLAPESDTPLAGETVPKEELATGDAQTPETLLPAPTPSFAQVLAATEAKVIAHMVRPGESTLEIAGRYDEAPRWLRKWNRLDGAWPRVGRPLSVRAQRRPPARARMEYRTNEGDTVGSVAVAHGIDARSLGRVLRRKSGATLPAGELLELWAEPTLMRWITEERDEGPQEIETGAWSVGAPDDGALANAVRIPDDPAWSLRFEHRAYGNTASVRAAVRAFRDFRARSNYTGPLRVWSMSRRYGGALPDHHSHQSGRDLDVKVPQRADLSATLAVRPEWIDGAALWHLLAALADTNAVDAIFLDHSVQALAHKAALELKVPQARRLAVLQFPRPSLSEAGLTRHASGHADHLHVRFSCPPWGVFCTDR